MVADADNDDPSTVQSSAESTESLEGIPKHWELGSIVPALWQPTYEQLFSSELERNRALATRLGVFVDGGRQRLHGNSLRKLAPLPEGDPGRVRTPIDHT